MSNNMEKLFRENLRKFRKAKGYRQIQLSLMLGLSQDYISEVERGRVTPPLKRFFKIAEALQIEPYKFFVE